MTYYVESENDAYIIEDITYHRHETFGDKDFLVLSNSLGEEKRYFNLDKVVQFFEMSKEEAEELMQELGYQ